MTDEQTYAGFQFTKWYLDCVGPDGEAAIAYWARLRWHGFGLAYSGLLHRAVDGRVEASSTLRPGPGPIAESGRINWSCGALDAEGEWRPRTAPYSAELWRNAEGRGVQWDCIAIAAKARVRAGPGVIEGFGYAERIELTVVPWSLPIRELRWGRWIGANRSLVWIEWRGGHPLTLILLDGTPVPGVVEDHGVQVRDGLRLEISGRSVIRSGRLCATVLGSIPVLRSMVPDAILSTQEDKWISRGMLRDIGGIDEEGWAIHEIVRFGGERA